VQLVAHAMLPGAQPPAGQGLLVAVVQVPDPLQTDAVVISPFVQMAGLQTAALSGKVQAWVSLPSHSPLQGAVPAQSTRGATGVPVTGVHVPSEPPSLHDSHCPSQRPSQQTPSAQYPLSHSGPAEHEDPLGERPASEPPPPCELPPPPRLPSPDSPPSSDRPAPPSPPLCALPPPPPRALSPDPPP
jgi:hypothetical protein